MIAHCRERSGAVSVRAAVACVVAVLAALAPAGCGDKEGERVEATLTTLSDANRAGDADTVISLLTSRTMDYYNDQIRLARVATKEQLLREGPSAVFQVLVLRLQYSEPQLKKLTAEAFIRETIKSGDWSFLFDDEELQVGSPVVSGDSARVPIQQRPQGGFRRRGRRAALASVLIGQPDRPTYQIQLVRDDDDVWRLDETSMVDMQDRLVEDLLSRLGWSLEAFANKALEDGEGKPPPAAMWSPPRAGAAAIRPYR